MPAFTFPLDIDGYLTASECRALYEYALLAPQGRIVELGTYKGRSAIAMALSGRPVLCVDKFEAETAEFRPLPDHASGNFSADDVRANATLYGVEIRVIEGRTAEVGQQYSGEPVALMFIDADHHYEAVKADFAAWEPHLADGAIVVFDDSLWEGVERFLMELQTWGPIPGPQVGGLTAMQRIKEPTHASTR